MVQRIIPTFIRRTARTPFRNRSNNNRHYTAASIVNAQGRGFMDITNNNEPSPGFIPFDSDSDDVDSDIDIDLDTPSCVSSSTASTSSKQKQDRNNPTKTTKKVPKHYRKSNPTIYDNISVYAPPDSNLIFRCSQRKADWYLTRHLARVLSPTSIHLNFAPAGQGRAGDTYFLETRENKCVVCGQETSDVGATMLHVVPEQYRKWFPLKLKSHSSHDILVACPDCNARWDREAGLIRKKIVDLYKVPLEGVGWIKDYEAGVAKRAAGAVVAEWTRRWEDHHNSHSRHHTATIQESSITIATLSKEHLSEGNINNNNNNNNSGSSSTRNDRTEKSKKKPKKKQGAIPLERLKVLEQSVLSWWEKLPETEKKQPDPLTLKRSNSREDVLSQKGEKEEEEDAEKEEEKRQLDDEHPEATESRKKKLKVESIQDVEHDQVDLQGQKQGDDKGAWPQREENSSGTITTTAGGGVPIPPPGYRTLLTMTMVEKAMSAQALYKAPDYKEHGQIVVGRVMASSDPERFSVESGKDSVVESAETLEHWRNSVPLEDAPEGWTDVEAFVRTWRRFFLEKIRPQHLSGEWRPENPV